MCKAGSEHMSEHHILTATLQGQTQADYLEQLSNQEFWNYAARLAAASGTSANQIEGYLECELRQGQVRAIFPLAALREVISPPHQITLLPTIPTWMAGLTAWRGEPIPVVSLDAYLDQANDQQAVLRVRHSNNQMLLVVQQEEITLGIFVAVVGSLTSLEPERLLPLEQSSIAGIHLSSHLLLGTYGGALILNIPEMLIDMMQQMRAMAVYE
jgi:chemotaxis signal transduction protein